MSINEKDLSHSQVVSESVGNSLKEKDTFGKASESTNFRTAATEFAMSVLAFKILQLVNHQSNSKPRQLIESRSSKLSKTRNI